MIGEAWTADLQADTWWSVDKGQVNLTGGRAGRVKTVGVSREGGGSNRPSRRTVQHYPEVQAVRTKATQQKASCKSSTHDEEEWVSQMNEELEDAHGGWQNTRASRGRYNLNTVRHPPVKPLIEAYTEKRSHQKWGVGEF